MIALCVGLALFLGIHLTQALAPQWRAAQIAKRGANGWKLAYTAVSLVGFGLIVWGFSLARLNTVELWPRIPGMNHLAALLTLIAFILVAAFHVPRNHIRATLKHPMTLGVKTWAFAHLIANNTLADLVLFGSFLLWSIVVFRAARRRNEPAPPAGTALGTVLTIVAGTAAWALMAFWLHGLWLGYRPLG